jgi:TolA-binding protein
MSAWCFYTLGDFQKAEGQLGELSGARDPSIRTKARFLRAKSLENLKKGPEAAELFRDLFTNEPDSPFADDALFDYAGIMGDLGKIDEAGEGYLRLYDIYRPGDLAEDALYKRAEVYYQSNEMEKARAAFNLYLQKYPGGELVDAALYWEALSAYRIGEKRAAALLWERLIGTYGGSPFRPDALLKTAEVYEELGEYQRALSLLGDLMSAYPKYSEEVDARLRADRIRYLIYGLSEREADLTARISRNRGADTREGRKAMVELSRIYILEQQEKLERAFQMLSQVLEKEDPFIQPEAQFYLGEYYYQKKEYEAAGKEFFKASLMDSENREFMAYSIYRAAQSMKQAGKTREVAELVERLENNFPGSEWSLEGKKLLGGKK